MLSCGNFWLSSKIVVLIKEQLGLLYSAVTITETVKYHQTPRVWITFIRKYVV